MNKKQMIALWIGLGVAILMILIVPIQWDFPLTEPMFRKNTPTLEYRFITNLGDITDGGTVTVVAGLLFAQLVLLTAVTAGAIYTLKDKSP